MKKLVGIVLSLLLVCPMMAQQAKVEDYHENIVISKKEKTLKTHWAGRRVAFLGDSMTDKRTLGPDMLLWWEYLSELLGFDACYNYGRSGRQWNQIHGQAQTLWSEHLADVDAIIIFAGTNDYNAGVPIG